MASEADDDEELKGLQETEVEALKAIFGADCEDLRDADVWHTPRPFELLLRLLPENSTQGYTEAHVSVRLHVAAGRAYPRAPPHLGIRDPVGLSEAVQAELLDRLRRLAGTLEGAEMVYQLAVEVGSFLAQHNQKGFCSMAEERVARVAEEAERRQEGVLQLEEGRRRDLVRRVGERRREIEEEQRAVNMQREREQSSRRESEGEAAAVPSRPGRRRGSRGSWVEPAAEAEAVEVRLGCQGETFTVLRGRPLGTNSLGQVTYSGFLPSRGLPCAVSRWLLGPTTAKPAKGEGTGPVTARQLAGLEQELAALARLPPHPNLVPCLGLGWAPLGAGLEVHLAQELAPGACPDPDRPLEPALLRALCHGALAGLAHLHRADLVHRDIRPSSLFLGPGGSTVRLADSSLDWRLRELLQEVTGVQAEDVFPPAPGRRGKKADIFRLGAVALHLAQGGAAPRPAPWHVPPGLPSAFSDFLSRCLAREERERWGAAALLEHAWLREPLPTCPADRQRSPSPPPVPAPPTGLALTGQSQSRLCQDFEHLFWIGKGAFGDVCKVRNLLDDQEYAIKRIRLNPADRGTNRKIMREVKLLSRLNHENVVRYYNSWRELTTTSAAETTTETETSESVSETGARRPELASSGLGARSFRPPATPSELSSVDWSVSWLPADSPSDGESDSEESEGELGAVRQPDDSSGSIVFDSGASRSARPVSGVQWREGEPSSETDESGSSQSQPRMRQLHYLYIQMEYCDKQTLRSSIDSGELWQDQVKVWRMFREMVEGLVHIHTQGMIHRDLKPVNIFIDSADHVKIGDFGLATTGLDRYRAEEPEPTQGPAPEGGQELTGQIGTAMYVAPELLGGSTTSYNQKVDLYSLGIIFFEMCSPPLATGMERGKVLGKLRTPAVELPAAWDPEALAAQTAVLRWLLDHRPAHRPTSAELAQSDRLPPAQVEEREMQQLVRNTMKNPRAPAYRRLMEACLAQPVPLAKDVSYDSDLPRPSARHAAATEQFLRGATAVFAVHGAVRADAPLLLPRTEGGEEEEAAVTVMTRSGDNVMLPYDLRVAYARQLARLGTSHQRRYSIGRVLREMKVFGLHPKEYIECAFDIAGPPCGSALADAEVLVVTAEVVQRADCWRDARLYYRLSHAGLAAGCLEQAGLPPEEQARVAAGLHGLEPGARAGAAATRLLALGLPEQTVASLAPLLEAEAPLAQLSSMLRVVTKRRGAASERVKAALAELRRVEAQAAGLGLGIELLYCVRPAPRLYSGLLAQLVREQAGKAGSRRTDVLAAGGRYDHLVRQFSESFRLAAPLAREAEPPAAAVGLSVSVDKVVAALVRQEGWGPALSQVVVAGHREEAARLARELWAVGVAARAEEAPRGEGLGELAREVGADMVVVCAEGGGALVSCWAEGRWLERKVAAGPAGLARWGLCLAGPGPGVGCLLDRPGELGREREESRAAAAGPGGAGHGGSGPVVNYNFTFLDRDRYSKSKKRLEVTKSERLAAALARFDSGTMVEVLALGFADTTLRVVANTLELEDEAALERSAGELCAQFPRHRKEFRAIAEEIRQVRFGPKCPVIVLYSLEGNKFRIMC